MSSKWIMEILPVNKWSSFSFWKKKLYVLIQLCAREKQAVYVIIPIPDAARRAQTRPTFIIIAGVTRCLGIRPIVINVIMWSSCFRERWKRRLFTYTWRLNAAITLTYLCAVFLFQERTDNPFASKELRCRGFQTRSGSILGIDSQQHVHVNVLNSLNSVITYGSSYFL